METIFMLFILIVALVGLIRTRLELEGKESDEYEILNAYVDLDKKYRKEKKSRASYQTWNTRYSNTIDELEEKSKDQADTIKKLNYSLDESYIAINAIGNEKNKTKRLELLDIYMTK